MKPSPRRTWQDFAGILKDLRRSEKWGRRLSRHPVFRVWDDAVGDVIAGVAQPVGVSKACLRVEVADSAWMQELQLMGGDILKKLNQALENGGLEEIRFRLGNSWQTGKGAGESPGGGQSARAGVKLPGLSIEDDAAVREVLRGFEDEELRGRVERLLARVHSQPPVPDEMERNAMKLEDRG